MFHGGAGSTTYLAIPIWVICLSSQSNSNCLAICWIRTTDPPRRTSGTFYEESLCKRFFCFHPIVKWPPSKWSLLYATESRKKSCTAGKYGLLLLLPFCLCLSHYRRHVRVFHSFQFSTVAHMFVCTMYHVLHKEIDMIDKTVIVLHLLNNNRI